MRPASNAEENRPAAVIPPVTATAPWRVAAVQALPDCRLHVQFVDGTAGVVDMAEMVNGPNAGVFAVLADPARFAEAYVELGAVAWPCGLDLAPDAMYRSIKTRGRHIAGRAA